MDIIMDDYIYHLMLRVRNTWMLRSTPGATTTTSTLSFLRTKSPIVFTGKLVMQGLDSFGLLTLA